MVTARKKPPAFEQLMGELEQIVSELEQGRLTLEQMLEKYADGLKALSTCRDILRQAEQMLPENTEESGSWS